MICKKCLAWNDDRANFCRKCGGELYESTLVTSPMTDNVTAYSIPTMGVRAFSGIGSGYLQSAVQNVAESGSPQSEAYHTYYTGAQVRPDEHGQWICPDCGERNRNNTLFCAGCGRYR